VGSVERGERNISIDNMDCLAKALEVDRRARRKPLPLGMGSSRLRLQPPWGDCAALAAFSSPSFLMSSLNTAVLLSPILAQ
jgi:hypothetical protein